MLEIKSVYSLEMLRINEIDNKFILNQINKSLEVAYVITFRAC